MARERQQYQQFTFLFEEATLPLSPEASAIIHAHLPPAVLPPVCSEAPADEFGDVPVPRPLPEAVAKGVFGIEDNDEPVDPSPDEVFAITVFHGERLTELLESVRHVKELLAVPNCPNRADLLRQKERLSSQAQSIVGLYAEDFGEVAARNFECWAAHKMQFEQDRHGLDESAASEPTPVSGKVAKQPAIAQSVGATESFLAGEHGPATASPRHAAASSPMPDGTVPASVPAAPGQSPVVGSRRGRGTQQGGLFMQTETATKPATRIEKLDRLHENVEQALNRLAESLEAGQSDTLKSWLKTMSRFHNYSLNNQMLIAFQRPDATHVAGFQAWKKFDRLVNKGEKGIMILAPVTRRVGSVEECDEEGKTKEKTLRQLVNTKVVYVFDVSQTHGEPLPELAKVKGHAGPYIPVLKELIAAKGIELYYADRLSGGAQGRSEGKRIGCINGLPPAEEFRTLAHELAHELLHRGERRQETTVRSRELEAESVAFVVCNAIGLDAQECSTDYLQLYRGNKQMLLESLQFIRQVSKDILSVLVPDDCRVGIDSGGG